jgi:hypothetical protein
VLVRSPGTRASEVREKKKEPESNRDQAGRDQIIGDHFALFHLQMKCIYIYVHSYIYPRQPASLQTCRSSGMGRGSHQCLTSIYLLIDNTTGCCMFFFLQCSSHLFGPACTDWGDESEPDDEAAPPASCNGLKLMTLRQVRQTPCHPCIIITRISHYM